MTRKKKCVECRYCEIRTGTQKGARHRCASKKRVLPDDVLALPACERFELPAITGYWGP